MNDHIDAPESIDELAQMLLEGKTVYLKTGSVRPRKLIEALKDKIAASEGAFETDQRLITQAVMNGPICESWNQEFVSKEENIGLLFYFQK